MQTINNEKNMGIEDMKSDEFAWNPKFKSAPGIYMHQQQRLQKN